jgi:uncharacterized protein YyaL (SSP411 family)
MANRLASATSAYLRAAAEQPVDWAPWGEEAFARARERGVPVLLDVGAAWCHYCHVMDRETYGDPAIAAYVNTHYVAVRVDRDERPDVDERYQAAVAQLNGVSGWPLTAFLTPEGTLYFGGTYFPKRAEGSTPSALQILTWAFELYTSSPEARAEEGRRLRQGLEGRSGWTRGPAPGPDAARLTDAAADLLDVYDRRHGGFGDGPKFLAPNALELWLRVARDPAQVAPRMALTHTLAALTRGAVHDRFGGGFHRYATDAAFEVPHYEKLLCTQAEMLRLLARAAKELDTSAAGDPCLSAEIESAARGTARYILRVLRDPRTGAFAASQAAEAGAEEGAFYLWTRDEILAAAGPDLTDATERFFAPAAGERSPLTLRTPPAFAARAWKISPAEALERLRLLEERLEKSRAERAAPPVDTTVIPAWNGLAATALAEASSLLAEPSWLDAARRAIDAVAELSLLPDGTVARNPLTPPLLDDAAAFAEACLALFESTGLDTYRSRAKAVLGRALERFFDAKAGAFLDRAPVAADPFGAAWPLHPFEDLTHASGNALALRALDRLLAHVRSAPAEAAAAAVAATIAKARAAHEPLALAGALVALDRHREAPPPSP